MQHLLHQSHMELNMMLYITMAYKGWIVEIGTKVGFVLTLCANHAQAVQETVCTGSFPYKALTETLMVVPPKILASRKKKVADIILR